MVNKQELEKTRRNRRFQNALQARRQAPQPEKQSAGVLLRQMYPRVRGPRDPVRVNARAVWIDWGAGPRASQYIVLGAKAHAVLHGRHFATTEDVLRVAAPVLRHRIITNFNAEADGIKPDDIVARLSEVISKDFATQHHTPETEPLARNHP